MMNTKNRHENFVKETNQINEFKINLKNVLNTNSDTERLILSKSIQPEENEVKPI